MATICPSCGARNLEGADACKNCGEELRTVDLPRPASQIERTVMDQPVTVLEPTSVHTISPQTRLDAAIEMLARQQIDLVEVVEDGCLVGVLTVRDLVTRVGANYADKLSRPVREFMTRKPETLPPDAPITFALNKMDIGGYRHLPIVQDSKLVGVVAARKLIGYLMKHSRETVATEGVTTSHGVEKH